MTLYTLGGRAPQIAEDVWVAPDACVIGAVTLDAGSSIWFGAVLRGDNEPIAIGAGTNVQESTVMHTDVGFALTVGRNCTIGHRTILHGCTVGDQSLIGMGSIVLNGAVIGRNCLIGAGTLVTEGKTIPDGSLVLGTPGKVIRALDDETIQELRASALHYQENARRFARDLKPL